MFYALVSQHFHQVIHNRGHGFSKRFIPAGLHYWTHTHRGVAKRSTQPFTSPQTSPGSHLARWEPHHKSGRTSEADLTVCVYALGENYPQQEVPSRYRETYSIVRTSVSIPPPSSSSASPAESLMCVRQMESPNYVVAPGRACRSASELRGFPLAPHVGSALSLGSEDKNTVLSRHQKDQKPMTGPPAGALS